MLSIHNILVSHLTLLPRKYVSPTQTQHLFSNQCCLQRHLDEGGLKLDWTYSETTMEISPQIRPDCLREGAESVGPVPKKWEKTCPQKKNYLEMKTSRDSDYCIEEKMKKEILCFVTTNVQLLVVGLLWVMASF